jgi:glycosyltransferase involved in cell wall biosynthesis
MTIETTIIIPIFNEEKYIEILLDSLIANDYDKSKLEILIYDGHSTDDTLKILNQYLKKYPFIHLFDNPKRVQVEALNLALERAKGEYIIRCDAHAKYPTNYITDLVKYLKNSKDKIGNIGFQAVSVASSQSSEAKAVSLALKSPFGVGISHRSKSFDKPIPVDTLLFGAWKKEIFNDVGVFDTNFIRGQDYEHNKRLLKHGYKIYLLPGTTFKYYTRPNIVKLSKMVYQYAYAKAQIIKKYKEFPSIRIVIPALFLVGLIMAIFLPIIRYLYGFYLFLILYATFREKESLSVSWYLFLSFIVMHLSHGFGFIRGMVDMFIFRKTKKKFKHTR